MLNNIRIILVETTHPGNIGATARAMKNMGLNELYLVKPKVFPHVEATARAAGADDILEHAAITDDLEQALVGCELVIGTSARSRTLPMQVLSPSKCAQLVKKETEQHKVAILFGRESSGLTNQELRQCHYQVFIPTEASFSSLNLASAVLLICYALRLAHLDSSTAHPELLQAEELASANEVEEFFKHLTKVLEDVEFLPEHNHRKLLLRIRRIFTRTRLEKREVNILRGILTAVGKKLQITNGFVA